MSLVSIKIIVKKLLEGYHDLGKMVMGSNSAIHCLVYLLYRVHQKMYHTCFAHNSLNFEYNLESKHQVLVHSLDIY